MVARSPRHIWRIGPGKVLRAVPGVVLGAVLAAAVAAGPARPAAAAELEYAYPVNPAAAGQKSADRDSTDRVLRFVGTVFAEAGIAWRARAYPLNRVYRNLRRGVSQFAILASPAERLAGCCLVSADPVLVIEVGAFGLAGAPPVRTPDDLVGRTVITILGYKYAGLAAFLADRAPPTRIFAAPDRTAAFDMLRRGRGDYVLDYPNAARSVLADLNMTGTRYAMLRRVPLHMVLHKAYPDAAAVMERLEAIVKTMDTSAVLEPTS